MKQPDTKTVNRVVLSSLIGATIEWYDFFLYGVMAGIVLNKLFFPADDPTTSLLLTYATFAVGFLTRPIGGIVFGHFGDRVGRKSVLVATLMIMGVSTVAIGLIPTYAQLGVWAPALLLLMRILQGIGLGGEWGGAVLMAYEYAPASARVLYQHPSDRPLARHSIVGGHAGRAVRCDVRSNLPGLGMAHRLSTVVRHDLCRYVDSPATVRNA